MASLNPSQNTTVTLYKNVDVDNDETLAFSSMANRETYFERHTNNNLKHLKCSPIKKDTGTIKIKANLADVIDCNYMSFINPDFGNKIYYCRIIIDPDFTTKKTVIINYMIDWWMTDLFTVEMDECFVEREYLSVTDYNKAEENPYNPTIMQFRTIENLPVSPDIEKPYYKFGTDWSTDDGVYCAKSVENEYYLDNAIGYLVIFSDISLKNADGDEGPGQSSPSYDFMQDIGYCVYSQCSWNGGVVEFTQRRSTLSFWNLSDSLYAYFATNYGADEMGNHMHQTDMGLDWMQPVALHNIIPMSNNKIKAPVSYVYVDSTDSVAMKFLRSLIADFTYLDSLESLLGIYPISEGMIMFTGSVSDQPGEVPEGTLAVKLKTAVGQNVVNKKLDLYPFSYYRLIAPNGDTKELRIEDFKSAQDGDDNCVIGMSLDITERPNLLIAPKNYKVDGASPDSPSSNLNLREGLIFSQFPTLPYAIDAFALQMASVVNNTIGNNTVMYEYERQGQMSGNQALLQSLKSMVGEKLTGIANDTSNAEAQGFINQLGRDSFATMTNVAAQQALYESAPLRKWDLQAQMIADASKGLTGDYGAIYDNYKYTKPAYVHSEYHPINGDGVINYNEYSVQDIIFMRVSINPSILRQYDKYFTLFGYQTSMCKKPYIFNYVNGSNDPDEIPNWNLLNGKYVTYVKTQDCKIIHSNSVSSAYIRGMFNNGVRFINGDALINE